MSSQSSAVSPISPHRFFCLLHIWFGLKLGKYAAFSLILLHILLLKVKLACDVQ